MPFLRTYFLYVPFALPQRGTIKGDRESKIKRILPSVFGLRCIGGKEGGKVCPYPYALPLTPYPFGVRGTGDRFLYPKGCASSLPLWGTVRKERSEKIKVT